MYFLSIIAVILASALMMCSGWAMDSWTWYLDPVSLVLLVLITVPIMLSAGLLKDFNNAFRFATKKNTDATYTQLKRSIEAVILFRRTLIASGAFTFVFSLVFVFIYNAKESMSIEKILASIAVASLSFLYALAFVIILLPLESRLKVKLQEMMHE